MDELWEVDPLVRSVRIWGLDAAGGYRETGVSGPLGLSAASVVADLRWPEG